MPNKLYMVITDSGDGSNGVQWVLDEKVIERMEELADEGDESYASGDGLQVRSLLFPDDFDITGWLKPNYLDETTLSDVQY